MSPTKRDAMTPITDVNVSLGRWPFSALRPDTPARLERHLRAEGIGRAWVSATESILFPDPDVYDEALFQKLRRRRTLRFVKTVNPTLPNWRESLEHWTRTRRIRAVKIFPNYHRYSLGDRCATELAAVLRSQRLRLLVQMRVDDERNQSPLMQVPGVPYQDVITLAGRFPRMPVVALCPYLLEAKTLAPARPNLCVDLSFMETPDMLRTALATIPARQIVFGSHTPVLYTRSAAMKLGLANIGKRQRRMIASGNAARIGL